MGAMQPACNSPSAQPFSIPIRNVSITDQIIRRGAQLSFGTPPQNFGFNLYPSRNNSYVFDTIYTLDGTINCQNTTTTAQCNAAHGGTFDESKSSTWTQTGPIYAAMEVANGGIPKGDFFGRDTVQLDPTTGLPDYPIGILRDNTLTHDALGLGSNSTLLNAFMSAKLISSRVWSLWWGQQGTKNHRDGSLILGGYDAAKTRGSNFTDTLTDPQAPPPPPFDAACLTGLQVTVADMTLNFANGTTRSIFGPSHSSAPFCIDPSFPDILVPPSSSRYIQEYTSPTLGGTQGIHAGSLTFNASTVFPGTLTVTLASGWNVTIANDELVVPDLYVQSDGSLDSNDPDKRVLRLFPLKSSTANFLPKLGQLFLSAAYLSVNYDSNQFTLWAANATSATDVVTIDSSSGCVNGTSLPTSAATNKKSPIGAIVGGVVGGIAFLTLLIFGILFYRARRRHKQPGTFSPYAGLVSAEKPIEDDYRYVHELGDEATQPIELDAREGQQLAHPSRQSLTAEDLAR